MWKLEKPISFCFTSGRDAMNSRHFIHKVSCLVMGDSSHCIQIEKEGNRSISINSMLYHVTFYMQKTYCLQPRAI